MGNKEHRLENQSPTEKIYPQKDYYAMPNTSPVSPVTIPAVVSMPRMNYDVPYNPSFPPNPVPYPAPQPAYSTASVAYGDIYNGPSHNMVLMNGGQHYVPPPDFANAPPPSSQGMDVSKRVNWEHIVSFAKFLS